MGPGLVAKGPADASGTEPLIHLTHEAAGIVTIDVRWATLLAQMRFDFERCRWCAQVTACWAISAPILICVRFPRRPLSMTNRRSGVRIKGDPSIRGTVFMQRRVESTMDRRVEQSLSILEELLTQRGVFHCQINFSSSQATVWTVDDPFRYRILDQDAFSDPDICLVYPAQHYPAEAVIPDGDIERLLDILSPLRMADENIYLRMSSINVFNGMVSVTFSCDGTHYMRYDEFLSKDTSFWLGTAA